jgi:hypothetical protein
MKEYKPIGQDQPDGDQGKRRSRVIIFKGEQQESGPYFIDSFWLEFKAPKGRKSSHLSATIDPFWVPFPV